MVIYGLSLSMTEEKMWGSILDSSINGMLVALERHVQAPKSNLALPALRHWGPHMAYFLNRINHSLCKLRGF